MFIKSAADDRGQSKAIQSINEKWGEGRWCGRETIGITVCKKKYAPFAFSVQEDGDKKVIKVERMFGCRLHSDLRKEKIERFGTRQGWVPFGQWSMRKALEQAKREAGRRNDAADASDSSEDHPAVASSDEEVKNICNNGKCAWKRREKFDDVYREVTGYTSSEEE